MYKSQAEKENLLLVSDTSHKLFPGYWCKLWLHPFYAIYFTFFMGCLRASFFPHSFLTCT